MALSLRFETAIQAVDEVLDEYEETLNSMNPFSFGMQNRLAVVRKHKKSLLAIRESIPEIHTYIHLIRILVEDKRLSNPLPPSTPDAMICKRLECIRESVRAHKCGGEVGDYCSRYCHDVDCYQQDAQTILDAFFSTLRILGKDTSGIQEALDLNYSYDVRDTLPSTL